MKEFDKQLRGDRRVIKIEPNEATHGVFEPLKIIGRVTHEYYVTTNGVAQKSKFTVLKSKSTGSLSDFLVDSYEDIKSLDLSNLEEGLYELRTIGLSTDYETGLCDDWELQLVEYKDE